MREYGADAAVGKAVDRALGHLQRGDVVAPVDQRGDAGVDLRQRADQIGDVVVLGVVAGRQVAVHVLEIVSGEPFGADAAQRRLPGVHVRIDETRHHDLVGGIDRLVGLGAEIAADRLDAVAGEQDFAAPEIAQLGIKRHQPAAADQHALHCRYSHCRQRAGPLTSASLCRAVSQAPSHAGRSIGPQFS